ncbi:MAG: FtsH protease activity modulator HflK [bacterium]|nr:FtsH protease activity modulator HflK [bacterium]
MFKNGENVEVININMNQNKKKIKFFVSLVLILIFFTTGLFTVGPEEVGVILRFGKYARTVESGLHFKIPFGVESITKVPVERQLKEEFGFRTRKVGIRTKYSSGNFKSESLMLTGDLNAAEVQWIVQYRINDPYKYLFKVRNTYQTFRDISEAVMREVVGDRTIDEVLTIGRQEISAVVLERMQILCDKYDTGIKVDQVVLQDVTPPEKVKKSFNKVNEAQQEKEKMINQALSEYNKVIPRAEGEALKVIEEAKGYKTQRVNNAQGDASRFNALYKEYVKAKEVTKQRIYIETMEKVFQKVDRKIISDDKTSGVLPLLNLGKEAKK